MRPRPQALNPVVQVKAALLDTLGQDPLFAGVTCVWGQPAEQVARGPWLVVGAAGGDQFAEVFRHGPGRQKWTGSWLLQLAVGSGKQARADEADCTAWNTVWHLTKVLTDHPRLGLADRVVSVTVNKVETNLEWAAPTQGFQVVLDCELEVTTRTTTEGGR